MVGPFAASAKPAAIRRGWYLAGGFAVLVVMAGGFIGWQRLAHGPGTATVSAPPPAVPVTVATAEVRDVPVYLTGLGTVQAFNTVTIRTQVDGQLIKVAFTEGQDVKTGDVLAQIDPRTYQAALDQALGKKDQDDANLANAKRDLVRYTDLMARNFAPQQQADTQRALVAQLEAQIQSDQGAIDYAQTQLSYTRIT